MVSNGAEEATVGVSGRRLFARVFKAKWLILENLKKTTPSKFVKVALIWVYSNESQAGRLGTGGRRQEVDSKQWTGTGMRIMEVNVENENGHCNSRTKWFISPPIFLHPTTTAMTTANAPDTDPDNTNSSKQSMQ